MEDFLHNLALETETRKLLQLSKVLDIEEVVPLDAEDGVKAIGIIGKCLTTRKFILWDLKDGFEISSFTVSDTETIL